MTTPPRPKLDETLARIDAVLDAPEPALCPLDDQPLQAVHRELDRPTVYVHRNGGQHPDRLGQVLATTEPEGDAPGRVVAVAYLFGRAIGWFRR